MNRLKGLYLITDEKLTPKVTIVQDVQEVLETGVKIIQLRDKNTSDKGLISLADELQELCRSFDALFVLNDRVDMAIKQKYDGLHVGKSDYHRLISIRDEFKGVLGVSCYGDIQKALEVEKIGVDYVAFGSFFPSPTKPNSAVVSLDVLKVAKENLNIPICAIGGINTENLKTILECDADMQAIISDVWMQKNRKNQILEYQKLYFKREKIC